MYAADAPRVFFFYSDLPFLCGHSERLSRKCLTFSERPWCCQATNQMGGTHNLVTKKIEEKLVLLRLSQAV